MKTVLGFDFGLKKMGVAVGQTITQTASPVEIVRVQNGIFPDAELAKLLKTWRPDALIVGMPLNMDGTISPLTDAVLAFVKSLEVRSGGLPVFLVDERLSTRHARYELEELDEQIKPLKKRKDHRIDAFAACLIVETWLKSN